MYPRGSKSVILFVWKIVFLNTRTYDSSIYYIPPERKGKGRIEMDDKNKMRKGKQNGSALLMTVLIGFCILAIIEIIYGQAQIRVERERLALEEENNQTVQELKAEWNQLKGAPSVGTESAEEAGGEQSGIAEGEKAEKTLTNTNADTNVQDQASTSDDSLQTVTVPTEDERQYDMQIVFLGDSIIDSDRESGGVAALISGACNAKVYNMAMGGTTAALLPGEDGNFQTWDSRCLIGVVNAILGNVDGSFLDGYRAGEILDECDFSKTDYFVIEYGINDFLTGKIYQSKYLEDGGELAVSNQHTYAGALSSAVDQLCRAFPDAGILIIAPHYCQFYNGETFVGDAYSLDYGYGTLVEFSRAAGYVAEQHKEDHVLFYNAMEQSGIDAYTADKYLKDGVHLTAEGRIAYAEYASRLIKADFYPEE